MLRNGRITAAQQRAYQQHAPRLRLNPGTVLDLPSIFGNTAGPCVLEIGFGSGESLLSLAAANPANRYIGIELYRPGIGSLVARLAAAQIQNVRFYEADASIVLRDCIADGLLHDILLLFPDPWPKKRHHKRRILQAGFLHLLHDKLEPGGRLHLATDWPSYASHIKALLKTQPQWRPLNNGAATSLLAGRAPGKYETRAHQSTRPIWQQSLQRR